MKLKQLWSKRVAAAVLSTTIAISGGFVVNPQPTQAAVSATTKANQIINYGYRFLGTPYKFGATYGQTRNFDCSSFTKYIFAKYGITLPRTAAQQAKVGSYVSFRNLKRGDLVFFRVPGRSGIGHVGVYLGNNKFLNTYGAGGVKVSTINTYWKSKYVTARRVIR
ncbi:C40 family peptidase [Paenibacillus chartarius]|uniref:C40 family peptidase n=1 Tax=Paenibacillus chartarius TaxID=747481 RepID=A0ABV6DG30_9BACL